MFSHEREIKRDCLSCSMGPQSKILFCWIYLQAIFASVFSDVWKAEVVSPVEALVSSCVVLPCKFNALGTQLPDSRMKGIWHKEKERNDRIYDEDSYLIGDNFKGRTKLVGRLSEKNCSLEIDDVKDYDSGPFCFRAELPIKDQQFSFVEKCVTITMKPEPDKPTVEHDEFFTDGDIAIFKCYVRHTCPTHHPTIQWSRQNDKPRMSYKDNGHGVWEVESLLSFTATETDDHSNVTCTVTFHGNKKSAVTKKIYIKRKHNIIHIIIPVAAVLGTIVVFGAACFFVIKRYKRQIQELQSRNPNVDLLGSS
ncbi:hypothetical protein AMELA_G00104290 [Ameiurus melas]|uniref:Ig-like domain-containing protein n=1 Tax=Ameiurus melas TaxID=219545 RepID=A0A7J6AUG1_AMEME|nr:hypothetical protein AMELA_G00104290 [Ameiurus melas]